MGARRSMGAGKWLEVALEEALPMGPEGYHEFQWG